MEAGAFQLTSVANLPNASVAFPGEHWSDGVASGAITPGVAIVPTTPTAGGRRQWKVAGSGDAITQLALALRPVDVPDSNSGPSALGPNEVRNQDMAAGEYVHAYYYGAFHLTLVVPDNYGIGDLIGWDANGARPTGKSGSGAWAKNAGADIDSVFEVIYPGFRVVNDDLNEGILTVKFVGRTQM